MTFHVKLVADKGWTFHVNCLQKKMSFHVKLVAENQKLDISCKLSAEEITFHVKLVAEK